MRIKVKIEDIEIELDRPKFREGADEKQEKYNMDIVVIPELEKMIEKAKELYKIKQNA